MKEIIFSFTLLLCTCSIFFAQDVPTALGPAPSSTVKVSEEPTPFLQVGTRAWTQISSTPTFQFGKSFLESCTITNIGSPFTITFPGGLLYYNGKVYTWNQSSPFQLWQIDTVTGVHTLQFNLTGVPQANLTGMYYDGTTVYGVSSSLAVSQIFSVNMTTGVCTPIGSASATCAGAIFLTGRLGAQYGAFSVDIVLDNLYKWNKTTGVATLVGPIGGNANYGQDACFDNNDFTLYWMSYTTGPQLRKIDTATGTAGPVLCTYSNQATGIVCLPPGGGPSPLVQPNQWCNWPDVPGAGAFWGHASVAYGDTLYIAGDGAATASTTFRKYSISSNTWTTGTPLPTPKTCGDLAVCGGKLYYIGGGASNSVGDGVTLCYDPATGTWTTKANQPTPVTGNVAEGYQDSIVYCISGGWTTYSTAIQVYRPGSNTWTTATPLPAGTGRRSFAGGLWGDKIFLCAGYSGVFRQDLEIGTISPSNPLTITWAAGPQFALQTSRPGGTAIAGRFYIVVGELSGGGAGNTMGIFDIASNTWLPQVGVKPTPTSNLWGVVSGSFVNCSGRMGVKIWVPGGSLTNTDRPFDVFADTCLFNCTVVTGNVTHNNNTVPQEYILHQNYPNPFNPTTKISFELPKAGNVRLVVYDLLGREVASLLNDYKSAGRYSVEFNASNFASGVYLYRLEAGDFKATKKMLLVK